MKKIKKILAAVMTLAMVLGMSMTTYAVNDTANITIKNAGANALFNSVQIVYANPQTTTGWDIKDEYMDYFHNENAFQGMDEQSILNGMISSATNGQKGKAISGFDSKYAVALDLICDTIEAPHPADPETGVEQSGSASPLQVNSAGVYVISGYETGFEYGTMAAYVAFGPYDTATGIPTTLADASVDAKRVPTTTEKGSNDPDKVVEIGREVEYTVTSTVPYIASTELSSAQYWFNDKITGAEYLLKDYSAEGGAKDTLKVSVTTDNGFAKNYYITPSATTDPVGQKISLNLTEILEDNKYANGTITIKYSATVTDTIVNNDASTGNAENTPSFGTDTENLYTGEIELIKYAVDDTENTFEDNIKLAGADFVMYKTESGQNYYAVVVNGKLSDWTTDKTSASTLTTDVNGQIKIQGLDLGTYYFEETKAPEGYSLDDTPVSVELKAGEDEDWVANAIVTATPATKLNTKLSALPSTGGIGTTIFTIGGCIIMIAAAGLFFASRRKSSK